MLCCGMTPNRICGKIRQELEHGPLAEQVVPYVAALRRQQYANATIVNHQLVLGGFSLWLRRVKCDVRQIDERIVDRFMIQHRGLPNNAHAALRAMLRQLRQAGLATPAKAVERSPAQCVAQEYREYLRGQRGMAEKTTSNYADIVERFLMRCFKAGPVDLRVLQPADLVSEVKRALRRYSSGTIQLVTIALRSFLRYLRYRGQIEVDLASAVPHSARWELRGLPRYLPAADVRRMLEHCECATALGRRNYAMLLLLAQLGLRASELLALTLEDLDWVNGCLRVRSAKGGPEVWTPLPQEAGAALATYLRDGRPACDCRQVFIRGMAPYVGLSRAGDVSNLVREALDRAAIKSRCRGAHVLRHSLATEMQRQGASLNEIGEMLRHRAVESTRRYAKVDVEALRALALPWPGGAL